MARGIFGKKSLLHRSKAESVDTSTAKKFISNYRAKKKNSVVPVGENDSVATSVPLFNRVRELEDETHRLKKKCLRLEVRGYLMVAQRLEMVARILAAMASIISFLLYLWCLFWVWDRVASGVTGISQMISVLIPWTKSFFGGCDRGWLARSILWLIRCGLASLPIIHHRTYHGLVHRRFEVFAVVFLFIANVKYTRRAAATYINNVNDHDTTDEDDLWQASNEINARFLYASVLRLRGLWTKTAQYMGSRADFLPVSFVRELSKLQDEAPKTPWEDVRNLLLRVGLLPDKISNVDESPIASASIGQVHTCTIVGSGERAVVKVQHPFARSLLLDDFRSLRWITWLVAILEPEYEFMRVIMNEWALESRKELNFLTEMKNLISARECIETMRRDAIRMVTNSSPGIPFDVEIPCPIQHLCSRKALVMSFCDGKRVDDTDQIKSLKGVPKEAILDALAQTFAHMMYVGNIFNADPHPGNLFVRAGRKRSTSVSFGSDNGSIINRDYNGGNGKKIVGDDDGFTIVLLDWGLAKRLTDVKRLAFCQLVYAAATFDFGLMMDSFDTMGLRLKRENVMEDMEGVRFLLRDMAPKEKSRKRIKAKMKVDRVSLMRVIYVVVRIW